MKKILILSSNSGEQSQVEANVYVLSKKALAFKSLQVFAIMIVMAFVSVLIPVMHFVLVPLCLVLAVVLPLQRWQKKQMIEALQIPCVRCHQRIAIKTQSFVTDLKVFCPACRSQLRLS